MTVDVTIEAEDINDVVREIVRDMGYLTYWEDRDPDDYLTYEDVPESLSMDTVTTEAELLLESMPVARAGRCSLGLAFTDAVEKVLADEEALKVFVDVLQESPEQLDRLKMLLGLPVETPA